MKYEPIARPAPRAYPHVVSSAFRQNRRWRVALANDRTGPGIGEVYSILGPGTLDGSGGITKAGRRKLIDKIAERARDSQVRYCIVWSPTDCTYLLADGTQRQGNSPPEGVLMAFGGALEDEPHRLEDLHYIELPAGAAAPYLCVKRTGDFVEVGLGAPMVVADFDEQSPEGVEHPSSPFIDADGYWLEDISYRGVRIESTVGWKLYGPVQPTEDATWKILRCPWPQDLFDACQELAEVQLSQQLLDAAWNAIDPTNPSCMRVGILQAA